MTNCPVSVHCNNTQQWYRMSSWYMPQHTKENIYIAWFNWYKVLENADYPIVIDQWLGRREHNYKGHKEICEVDEYLCYHDFCDDVTGI